MRDMKVRLSQSLRQNQAILRAFRSPQLLKQLRAKHLAQSIRRIYSSIDQRMHHVNTTGSILCIERLTQHSSTAHGGSMGMLPRIATHRRSGRRHNERTASTFSHQRKQ